MSVSQVKKRFVEFETYLKRDAEGLRRLKLLKDDVNVLRIELAAAIEAKQTAEEIRDAARVRADTADSEREALRVEIHTLKQQVASLERDLSSVTQPDEDDSSDEPKGVDPGRFSTEMKTVLKSLRKGKEMPHIPKWHELYQRDGGHNCHAFYRNDIATGWSRRSLYLIGALVALMVDFEGEVKIRSNANTEEDSNGLVKDETLIRHMLTWMKPAIDWKLTEKPGSGIYRDNVR